MAPFPPTLAGSSQKRTAHKRASSSSKVQHRAVPAHVPAAGGVGGGGQWDDDDVTVDYCVGEADVEDYQFQELAVFDEGLGRRRRGGKGAKPLFRVGQRVWVDWLGVPYAAVVERRVRVGNRLGLHDKYEVVGEEEEGDGMWYEEVNANLIKERA